MIILSFIAGIIITFVIVCLYGHKKIKQNDKLEKAMKIATESIAENIANTNLVFDKLHEGINNKSMENILRIKLEEEEEIKKIDDETLKKITEI